ncbi:MAG: DUF1080 domain-containing protein [Planctomycetota bacterium]|nr:DUF1080 domain-containing protein [Planctomycetota bacterium]
MKKLLLIALLGSLVTPVQATDEWKSLFDGKTLKGWEGKKEFWSVQDGAITGQTTKEKPTKGNTFIIWRGGETADFELRMKFKIVGGNSGIQYRSEELDNFVVKGYQADIDTGGHRFMGILYGERTGRGVIAERTQKVTIGKDGKKVVDGKTCDNNEFLKAIKKEAWNDYTIIAKGDHLLHIINGYTTVDVTDHEKRKVAKGILALQLHAGPPMKVQFKEIKMKILK